MTDMERRAREIWRECDIETPYHADCERAVNFILTALRQTEAEALERAAKVAESKAKEWLEWEPEAFGAEQAAYAIRSLAHEQGE